MGVGLVVRAGSLFLIYTNMTLHEAIILVISSVQKQLTCSEVANEINRKHLYIKRDGSFVEASQIMARINKYPHLFQKDYSTRPCLISLILNEH